MPIYRGWTLRRKDELKAPLTWDNTVEHGAIHRHIGKVAMVSDQDWATSLIECHADPAEGYLHTALSSREVLPFSVAYGYCCTLGQQQPDLHERLVYSSV